MLKHAAQLQREAAEVMTALSLASAIAKKSHKDFMAEFRSWIVTVPHSWKKGAEMCLLRADAGIPFPWEETT